MGALKRCGRCCANLPTGTSGCSSSGTLWQQPFILPDDHPSRCPARCDENPNASAGFYMDSGSWWDANSQRRAIALGVATGWICHGGRENTTIFISWLTRGQYIKGKALVRVRVRLRLMMRWGLVKVSKPYKIISTLFFIRVCCYLDATPALVEGEDHDTHNSRGQIGNGQWRMMRPCGNLATTRCHGNRTSTREVMDMRNDNLTPLPL
jgi:hypothetical protein